MFTPTPVKAIVVLNEDHLKDNKKSVKNKFIKNNYEEELARKILRGNRNQEIHQ